MQKKVLYRRIGAYIIDSLLISLLLALFAKIPLISMDSDKYYNTYEEYLEVIQEKATSGETISQELIAEYQYNLAKNSINTTVVNLALTAFYFIVFQFLNKGQTLGKKLLKIKVVNKENKNPNILQMLIHGGIAYSIFATTITVLLYFLASKKVYVGVINYVQLVDMGLVFATIIMMLFRKDERGLHNILAGTKVIHEVNE